MVCEVADSVNSCGKSIGPDSEVVNLVITWVAVQATANVIVLSARRRK